MGWGEWYPYMNKGWPSPEFNYDTNLTPPKFISEDILTGSARVGDNYYGTMTPTMDYQIKPIGSCRSCGANLTLSHSYWCPNYVEDPRVKINLQKLEYALCIKPVFDLLTELSR